MAVQSEVFLYVYDLSKGNAKALSSLFLGKEFPGIWHTSVTVYDREYFFGGFGIQSCMAGTTNYGVPEQIIPMGHTEIPYNLFLEYLSSLGDSVFTPTSYDIFNHNCNNFTNEITIFLTGKGIPEEILNLPSEFLSMPLIRTLLSSFNISPSETGVSFHQPSGNSFANNTINNNSSDKETHKLTSSTSPVDLKSNHIDSDNNSSPPIKPEASLSPPAVNQMSEEPQESRIASKNEDEDEEQENEKDSSGFVSSARRSYKYDDPPIIFKEIDGIAALKKVEEMVVNLLNPRQQELLKEIGEYLQSDSGAWAIGDEHLDLIAYLLNGGDGKFAPNVTLLTLEVLQAASLKEDVVLILHQDRKDHRIMSYINKIENLTLAEQEEIVKLLCNLCGQPSSFDWLLYISEWCEENGQPNSNSRVTIRAAVHTLLNDQLTTLQRNGVYLIYNLSLKEVFEDVSIELATAVLQYMHSDLPDDQALLCLTAITRFIDISMNDVPALIKMLGPDLNKYKGKNEKMDKLIKEIGNRVDRLPSFS